MPTQPHRHRAIAESFGVDAARYDRTRPGYPGALIHRIMAAAPGRRVLDAGTGTGILARQLRAAGATVLGVEPDARMAAFARDTGIDVEVATLETWRGAGRTFDAVVAGTAWHWIDPEAGPAAAARALRTGGLLAVFGQAFQLPTAVAEAMAASFERVAPDAPAGFRGMARAAVPGYERMYAKAADGIRASGAFTEPEPWRFDWTATCTRAEWLDQLPTAGILTQLPPEALAEISAAVGAAIDALGGSITVPYATVGTAAHRR